MKRLLSIMAAVALIWVSGLALACSAIPKSSNEYKSSGPTHNMGTYEYDAQVDAWVLADSWYEPAADLFVVGPDDYIHTEPGWSNSILFINADPFAVPPNPGGGGGTPPGGGGGQIPKSLGSKVKNDMVVIPKSCPDDAADLGNLSVVGISGGLRNWFNGGVSRAWAVIGYWG